MSFFLRHMIDDVSLLSSFLQNSLFFNPVNKITRKDTILDIWP